MCQIKSRRIRRIRAPHLTSRHVTSLISCKVNVRHQVTANNIRRTRRHFRHVKLCSFVRKSPNSSVSTQILQDYHLSQLLFCLLLFFPFFFLMRTEPFLPRMPATEFHTNDTPRGQKGANPGFSSDLPDFQSS